MNHKICQVGLALKTRRTAFRHQLHFNEAMLLIIGFSHLFVATARCNATQVAKLNIVNPSVLAGDIQHAIVGGRALG